MLNKFIFSILAVVLFIGSLQAKHNLKFVSNLFRHGARGPVNPNLNTDNKFNQQYKDELTPTGQRQHYELGRQLRERYIEGDKYGLGLSETYNPTEIYVYSTNYNRTISSAQAQLTGLYPPGTGPKLNDMVQDSEYLPAFKGAKISYIGNNALPNQIQSIPIHTTPMEYDYFLVPNNPSYCPGMVYLASNYFRSEFLAEMSTKITEKYQLVFDEITKILDLPEPMTFMGSQAIWDTLISNKYNGQPCKGQENITEELWESLKELDTLYWFLIYGGDPQNTKIGGTSVLSSWIKQSDIKLGIITEGITENEKKLKYVMHSAHDLNVLNLLIPLQFSSFQCVWELYSTGKTEALNCNRRPFFASSVIYELYVENDQNDAYVKIMYDGEYQYLCGVKNTQCSYNEFKKIIQDYIYIDGKPENGTYSDQYCQLGQDENQEENLKKFASTLLNTKETQEEEDVEKQQQQDKEKSDL